MLTIEISSEEHQVLFAFDKISMLKTLYYLFLLLTVIVVISYATLILFISVRKVEIYHLQNDIMYSRFQLKRRPKL